MSFKPLKPQNVSLKKLTYSELKKLGDHANVVYMNYDKQQFYVKTPELVLPFDSGNMFADPKNDQNGKYSIRVSLDHYQTEGHQDKAFYDMLVELDKMNFNEGKKNSFSWFKKKSVSDELLKEIYNPLVKFSTDQETGEPTQKYPPTFAFKIMQRDGLIQCKCYDGNSKEKNAELNVNNKEEDNYVTLEQLLKKKSRVKVLLRCNGIWVVGGKFGCTWRADQIMITPAPGYDDCAFLEDSDEDVDEVVTKLDNFIESDDDEEDDTDVTDTSVEVKDTSVEVKEEVDSSSEEEPEPVKKKKVRKAKKSA